MTPDYTSASRQTETVDFPFSGSLFIYAMGDEDPTGGPHYHDIKAASSSQQTRSVLFMQPVPKVTFLSENLTH